jgi:hypothetical protein
MEARARHVGLGVVLGDPFGVTYGAALGVVAGRIADLSGMR